MLYFAQNQFLGNQLWPLAAIAAFAIRHDLEVTCPNFRRHAQNFAYFSSDRYCRFPNGARMKVIAKGLATESRLFLGIARRVGLVHSVVSSLDETVDLDAVDVAGKLVGHARRRVVYMHGLYFLCHSAIAESREKIRSLFRIQESLWIGVRQTIISCRARGDVVVGLHVRRGDYLGVKDDLLFSLSDYETMADKVVSLFYPKKVVFLVCATEMLPVSAFNSHEIIRAPGHYVQDMYCLANCDVIIGPPSTYSQWSSFYGGVPIFTMNSINEIKYGLPVSEPRPDNFFIHLSGCGRHSRRQPVNLCSMGLI
jgi:hypothetical protein